MDSLSTIILIAALFIIMIGMGLTLTMADFKRVLKFPVAVFAGFLNQIILLPIIGYGLVSLFNVDAEIAIGVMILAACPGGPTSNLVTLLAKGDIALSVSLTAVNSLLTIVSIPIIVNFALQEFATAEMAISAPIDKIAGALVVVIAIPLIIGMLVRKFKPLFANKMEKPVRIASAFVITLVIVGLTVKERANFLDYFAAAGLIALALNVSTMTIGYIVAKIFRLNFRQALTIAIESGNQNGTLAIHVAVVSLASPAFAIVAAVYSLIMYLTATVPIYFGNKKPNP